MLRDTVLRPRSVRWALLGGLLILGILVLLKAASDPSVAHPEDYSTVTPGAAGTPWIVPTILMTPHDYTHDVPTGFANWPTPTYSGGPTPDVQIP